MNKNNLAIVIPAYKSTFLSAALDSIAAQTCKDFTLYIGDDCSPHDLKSIVDKYTDKINIVYKRFDENLGGRDLVAQWERCIDMTQGEEWLWLFSDDDVMESECVASFFKEIQINGTTHDIYHFNVKVINDKGIITRTPKKYPLVIFSIDYYKGKMSGVYISLVVENIFSRNVYEKNEGFQNFDLAWGSDTATWIKFMNEKGMKSIIGPNVLWRSGSENISSSFLSPIIERKISALNDFFFWSYLYFRKYHIDVRILNIRAFISRMSQFKVYCSSDSLYKSVKVFCRNHSCKFISKLILFIIKLKNRK